MRSQIGIGGSDRFSSFVAVLRKPQLMVFLPAFTLASFWMGGEKVLMLVALGLPLIFALAGAFRFQDPLPSALPDGSGGLALRPQIVAILSKAMHEPLETGKSTACLVVLVDDAEEFLLRHGRAAHAEVMARMAERICSAMRQGDTVGRLEGGGFAVALVAQRRLDVETLVQLSARIQSAISPPISVDAIRLYVSCSVGFCLSERAPEPSGKSVLEAALIAADDAVRCGPGAIRAFSPDMVRKRADSDSLRATLEMALDEGQIRPHFQPQLSTDTGAISGFEALARWYHPERGLVPPGEFLPAIEAAGLSERLGEVILYNALSALVRWDKAGLKVPTVGVNFSAAELRNPKLVEKLKWELDRFNLTPERLSVEVLETVVADTDNDVIVHNIAALVQLGCGVDLDDFGTGHASITNIRRFAVRRIKIDRSFVTRVDEDRDQQRMISAVLSLAERLGLETLAEGVETPGEHAMLSQLGCGHVQGFGIARPMPYEATADWICQHRAQLATTPRISHRAR